MADQFIALDEPAVTDKKLDSSELTVGANTVQRERLNIADPTVAAGLAKVVNTDPTTEYGLVVRFPSIPAGTNAIGKLAANSGVDIGDVDVTSCALPTGASTAAKQPALGTAGTASADVITVQGIAAMTPLLVNGSGVTQPVSDAGGNLSIDDGGNSITVDGTVATSNFPATVDTNSGNKSASTLRVVLATDQPALTNKLLVTPDAVTHDVGSITTAIVPGTGATNLGKAEDAAHASSDVGVMTLAVRKPTPTDLSAGATDGDYEPMQVSRDGLLWTAAGAAPQGGYSVATGSIGATKTDIGSANTAGVVGGWYFYNPNASVVYVQFFNTQASGVTLGTTAPVYSLGIPATSAANLMSDVGIQHSTAICIAITTTRAGSTGPGSTVDYNIFYKQ